MVAFSSTWIGFYSLQYKNKKWRCHGMLEYSLDSHAESPGSNPAITQHFCPSARQLMHIAALDPGVY